MESRVFIKRYPKSHVPQAWLPYANYPVTIGLANDGLPDLSSSEGVKRLAVRYGVPAAIGAAVAMVFKGDVRLAAVSGAIIGHFEPGIGGAVATLLGIE
jgi:hypothetical protein